MLFRDLLADFKDWAALDGFPVRRYTRAWLMEALAVSGHAVRTQPAIGRLVVSGLVLSRGRPELPEARFGWKAVVAFGHARPEDAVELPVDWRFNDKRTLPPDEVTWQLFLDECAQEEPEKKPIPDTHSRRYKERIFVRWDTLCEAFWRWLDTKDASHGARDAYDRGWLHSRISLSKPDGIHTMQVLELRRVYSTLYVLGLALKPEWDVTPFYASRRNDSARHAVKRSAAAKAWREAHLEARAKIAAGFALESLSDEERLALDTPRLPKIG